MGPYGLPALMRDAKRFKVRGKGHEVSHLSTLHFQGLDIRDPLYPGS